jgi:hypothetical protein
MMNTRILKTVVGVAGWVAVSSFAQMTPVGTWHNIDDKTGEAKAEIQIVEKRGCSVGAWSSLCVMTPTRRKHAKTARMSAKVKTSLAWKSSVA